ncbi:MAG: NADH:flavin oxidoreductase/NADH oxidase [Sulfuricellaceae bacterium]|jgi:2,4-dienoyl-CoA reductase-like NADH-dependent reductase (Old Yellow Enzyme family)
MSQLFTPLTLRGLTLRNRVFLSPMCQYSANEGMPGPWHLVHYGSRAVGGAGLVMVEATSVVPHGRISPHDLGLWSDVHARAFRPLAAFIKDQGAAPAVQLAHAGRKASCAAPWDGGAPLMPNQGGWQPLAPSPLPFFGQCYAPKEMSLQGIDEVVVQFAEAAHRARESGFDAVEVHMAHGYLLHEFLSPLTNRREDDYGGSLENRMRLPLRVAKAVRDVWPDDLPVLVRLSATDWVEGGWDLPQSVMLAKQLKALGIDLIDVSSGGLTADAQIPFAPGFQTPFAAAIRQEASIAVGTVGLITRPSQAEQVLATHQADAVFLGRELLRNPYWPLEAAKELGVDPTWPKQYQRAKP